MCRWLLRATAWAFRYPATARRSRWRAGGIGGRARAEADAVSGAASAVAEARVTGGQGGAARDGASGGAGAAVVLKDAVTGSAPEELTLLQRATGGRGGAAEGAGSTAGRGGFARSALEGANPAGGDLTVRVSVTGGDAGSAFLGAPGGRGGDAETGRVSGSVGEDRFVDVEAVAAGGRGGDADGEAGAGGRASLGPVVGSSERGDVRVAAELRGGAGGNADGFDGEGPGRGGAGRDAELVDAVWGSTRGALRLEQRAFGGNGGRSRGVEGGAAGTAESRLHRFAATRELSVSSTAAGGAGGAGRQGADGGVARVEAIAGNARGSAVAEGTARGGDGGGGEVQGGDGGAARAELFARTGAGRGAVRAGAPESDPLFSPFSCGGGFCLPSTPPSDPPVTALGGRGGSIAASAAGRAGAGGDAISRSFALGRGGVTVQAIDRAQGGDAGLLLESPFAPPPGEGFSARSGDGGDARSTAVGVAGSGRVESRAWAQGGSASRRALQNFPLPPSRAELIGSGSGGDALALALAFGSGEVLADARAWAGESGPEAPAGRARSIARALGTSGEARAEARTQGGAFRTLRATASDPVRGHGGARAVVAVGEAGATELLPGSAPGTHAFAVGFSEGSADLEALAGSARIAALGDEAALGAAIHAALGAAAHRGGGPAATFESEVEVAIAATSVLDAERLVLEVLDVETEGGEMTELRLVVEAEGRSLVDEIFGRSTARLDGLARSFGLGGLGPIGDTLDLRVRLEGSFAGSGGAFRSELLLATASVPEPGALAHVASALLGLLGAASRVRLRIVPRFRGPRRGRRARLQSPSVARSHRDL